MNNQIELYQSQDGKIELNVHVDDETLWLSQRQMAELFDKEVPTIIEHIANIYKEQELDKKATTRKFRIVQQEGKRNVTREVEHYNLDVIISVGYRVHSHRGTQFRIWATQRLKDYLLQGYVINEKLLSKKEEHIEQLKNTLSLLCRALPRAHNLDEVQSLTKLLNDFAVGLNLLDDFDHKALAEQGLNKQPALVIERQEYLAVIAAMKSNFISDVFAQPKDDSFDSSISQIYQSFGGQECYPTLEEKAAMLLYLLVKNHSFTDGNKRIGAACFLYFLKKNSLLYTTDNQTRIDNTTLFALTLLVAESKPQEMETMKQVIISVLNACK
ncbi:MAG: virulence protein RhuM/Fic/DOC family protein [Desulfovibrionaceae bacterium]|nr:virulence protein RhuM/Fic/DOC family protein [Desulfovibrionaceae bacterium]